MAGLYILHFDRPYWNKAQHYVGYTKNGIEDRIAKHRSGNGSLLVAYALKHGNDFVVAHTEEFAESWQARQREWQLKKGHNLSQHCEVCWGERNKEVKHGRG